MRKTQVIEWQPFSKKHKKYIENALNCKMSVAEGSIRSGKTIDNCIIAAAIIEETPDKIHLASGSSLANAKMNIGDCNGFGLEHLFRGRCRWGKYKGNEALFVYTKTGEKIIVFAGGGLANSYKKILGNSYGLWIATEINEHYDSDDSRTSFIKVAMGRQMMSKNPRILWDLNPCNPRHSIYTDYIDNYLNEDVFVGGYNYQHFTMFDNKSLTREEIDNRTRQYDKNSIWYKRDILGERCIAEGLIYRQFADNPDSYTTDKIEPCLVYNIGVDFGGNGSATTFVLTGFAQGFKKVRPILSERHAEELDPEQLNKLFANFVNRCYTITGKPITVYADSAEQILIRGLRKTVLQQKLPCTVHNALKKPILERIRLVNKLIAQNIIEAHKGAQTVIDALCEAVWEKDKDDVRLDDGTSDIDTLDAFEYSIEPYFYELSRI